MTRPDHQPGQGPARGILIAVAVGTTLWLLIALAVVRAT